MIIIAKFFPSFSSFQIRRLAADQLYITLTATIVEDEPDEMVEIEEILSTIDWYLSYYNNEQFTRIYREHLDINLLFI